MKKWFSGTAVLVAALGFGFGQISDAHAAFEFPFDDAFLQHYYPFDGDANDAADAVDLTAQDDETYQSSTAPIPGAGDSVSLDGSDWFLGAPATDFAVSNGGNYTVAVWVNTTGGGLQDVFSATDATAPADHGILIEILSDGTVRFLHRPAFGTSGGTNLNSTSAVNDGEWHHIVIRRDGNDLDLFIDGANEDDATDAGDIPGNLEIIVGQLKQSSPSRFFTGNIDDLRIYETFLTDDEILQLFKGGVEVLYLTDTDGDGDGVDDVLVPPFAGDGISRVFRVTILDGLNEAVIEPLNVDVCADTEDPGGLVTEDGGMNIPGAIPWNHIDILAATPDGSTLIMVDDGPVSTGEIIHLDVATGACPTIVPENSPFLSPNSDDSDQGAIDRNGVMYIGNNANDSINTLNYFDGTTSEIGILRPGPDSPANCSETLDLKGSDWTFDNERNLWIWINVLADRGLYKVPAGALGAPSGTCGGNSIFAEAVGAAGAVLPDKFTGWATRYNGFGNVVGSNQTDETVYELSVADGSVVAGHDMVESAMGPIFLHTNGDMSNGPLALCGNRTRGYWTTHTRENFRGANQENERLVTLCDGTPQVVSFGSDIPGTADHLISELKGNSSNLTQLLHQLVAAILNCQNAGDTDDTPTDDDCTRSGALAEAEEELCTVAADQSATMPNDVLAAWENTSPTSEQNDLTEQLDNFNNQTDNEGFCARFAEEEDDDGENGGGPQRGPNALNQSGKKNK